MNAKNEELLLRVTLGELDPCSPEVQAARAGDPQLDRALKETAELMEGLEGLPSPETAILADAAKRSQVPGEELAPSFVRERMGKRVRTPRWLTAAMLLLLATSSWWFLSTTEAPPGPGDTILSERVFKLLDPIGELGGSETIDAVQAFHWQDNVTIGTYQVIIHDVAGILPAQRSPLLSETTWRLTPEESERLPEVFEWEVHWTDGDEQQKSAGPARVSR